MLLIDEAVEMNFEGILENLFSLFLLRINVPVCSFLCVKKYETYIMSMLYY